MAGGALTLSVGLSAASWSPFPRGAATPEAPGGPALRAPQLAHDGGLGSHRAGLGETRIGEGALGTASREGRREAREAGRARSAPALVGGCEQVAVGVCRACQQLCQERLARARAQEAGSCQPLARAVRGVRTPPHRGSHRLLPHPHKLLGLGIPEDKGGGRHPGGAGWGRGHYSPNHRSCPGAGPCCWPLGSAPHSSPRPTWNL